jgi:hypothetical protein
VKSKINISIDDVSPHPKSSIKVVEECKRIINIFPDIKFSLFIPMAYWRTMPSSGMKTSTPYPLTIYKYEKFCKYLKRLPKENFELCYHGLYHGIPYKSNNDEFESLSYNEAVKKYNSMFDIVRKSDLESDFKKIFRPPAWRMSPGSIKAAQDAGIEILALSPDEYAKKTYQHADESFKSVVYYNVNPPFKELKLFDKTEIVYHACEWDRNHLSTKRADELIKFLQEQDREIEFTFMEGVI